jgi:hypothetical protein
MREVTDENVNWIVNACFGRHKNIEDIKNKISIHNLVKIILFIWEASDPDGELMIKR